MGFFNNSAADFLRNKKTALEECGFLLDAPTRYSAPLDFSTADAVPEKSALLELRGPLCFAFRPLRCPNSCVVEFALGTPGNQKNTLYECVFLIGGANQI